MMFTQVTTPITGNQIQELQKVLLNAFDKDELSQMVRMRLGRRLDAIASGSNTSSLIFNLIEWAERTGNIANLINGAMVHNSRNPMLAAFAKKYPDLLIENNIGATRFYFIVAGEPSAAALECKLRELALEYGGELRIIDTEPVNSTKFTIELPKSKVLSLYSGLQNGLLDDIEVLRISLADVDLSNLDLTGAIFASEFGVFQQKGLPDFVSRDHRADLSGANLGGVTIRKADLSGADLSGANLRGADLRGANLGWAKLRGADLSWADLRKTGLRGADLSGAKLRGADLSKTDLGGVNIRRADLIGAKLRGADLSKTNLRGADLRWADLRGADLRWADLSEANLSGTNLLEANLSGTNLLEANLSRRELNEAVLRWATPPEAVLRWATPPEANLGWAKLLEEVLREANLNEMELIKAILRGANLSETDKESFEDSSGSK